jgi:hypothetical protein
MFVIQLYVFMMSAVLFLRACPRILEWAERKSKNYQRSFWSFLMLHVVLRVFISHPLKAEDSNSLGELSGWAALNVLETFIVSLAFIGWLCVLESYDSRKGNA